MLNANQILKLTEDDQVQSVIDIFTITASQFIKKLKSIGAEIDISDKTSTVIRGSSIPRELYTGATYKITIPELATKNKVRIVNKLTQELRKNFVSLGPTKLFKSKIIGLGNTTTQIAGKIELYSSRHINVYLNTFVINILNVAVFVVDEPDVIKIQITPSLSFLIYDLLRLFRINKVKEIDIKNLSELVSDEILAATDVLIKGLRLTDFGN